MDSRSEALIGDEKGATSIGEASGANPEAISIQSDTDAIAHGAVLGTAGGRSRVVGLAALLAISALAPVEAAVGISVHNLDVAEVPRYASMGARVVRVDLPWSNVVHHDREVWEPFDAFVTALRQYRMTPLLVLQWDREDHVTEPAALAEFARFASVAAARYPAAIFEILNEPNLRGEAWPYVGPEEYARVAGTVAATIRAQTQRAQIIGPALGGGSFDGAWLARAFNAGLLDHVDAVSVHPYAVGAPEGAPAYYRSVRELMRAANHERPIVVSEWGYLTDEEEQADLTLRALEINGRESIGMTVLYRWRDLPGHEFGLTRADGSEKLVVGAVRSLLQ